MNDLHDLGIALFQLNPDVSKFALDGLFALFGGLTLFLVQRGISRRDKVHDAMVEDLEKLKTENAERREAIAVLRERLAALEGWRGASLPRGGD